MYLKRDTRSSVILLTILFTMLYGDGEPELEVYSLLLNWVTSALHRS
jgi:hypothetical protein